MLYYNAVNLPFIHMIMRFSSQYCNHFNLVIADDFNSISDTKEYYFWLFTCGYTLTQAKFLVNL